MEPQIAYRTLAESGEKAPVNENGVAMPDGWPVYKRRCTVQSDIDAAIADGLTLVSVADYQSLVQNYLENHSYWLPDREERAELERQQLARERLRLRRDRGPQIIDEISLKITSEGVGDTERKGMRSIIVNISTLLQVGSFQEAKDELIGVPVAAMSDSTKRVVEFAKDLIDQAIEELY